MTRNLDEQLSRIYSVLKTRSASIEPSILKEMSPPLLVSVPDGPIEVAVIGQETFGWELTRNLRLDYPHYPHEWMDEEIRTYNDFLRVADSIPLLMKGYRWFEFAAYQPTNWRSPFWHAFRYILTKSASGRSESVVWSNLVKMDYRGESILNAEAELFEIIMQLQSDIIRRELLTIEPNLCIFFTGPTYDPVLTRSFPGISFVPVHGFGERELVVASHDSLPPHSFRTYHPQYLSFCGAEYRDRVFGVLTK